MHKLMWRGSPDGVSVTQSSEWRHTHRFRAIYLTTSNDTCETRKVRMTKRDLLGREYQIDADLTLADLNERYMNVRPTQHAVQCEPHLCAHVEAVLPFAPKASLEEMADNRYVLDVDGNAYDFPLYWPHRCWLIYFSPSQVQRPLPHPLALEAGSAEIHSLPRVLFKSNRALAPLCKNHSGLRSGALAHNLPSSGPPPTRLQRYIQRHGIL